MWRGMKVMPLFEVPVLSRKEEKTDVFAFGTSELLVKEPGLWS